MYAYRNYDSLECALTPCVSGSEDFMNSLRYQMLSLLLYPCESTVRGKGLLDLQFGGDTVPIVVLYGMVSGDCMLAGVCSPANHLLTS